MVGLVVLAVVAGLLTVALTAGDDDDGDAAEPVSPLTTLVAEPELEDEDDGEPSDVEEPGDSALGDVPSETTGPDGAETGDSVSVFDLEAGDCFDDPEATTGTLTDIPLLACDAPHDNEVFAIFDLAGGPSAPFPGATTVDRDAVEGCQGARFTTYVGRPFAESRFLVTTITPNRQSWEQVDDREVVCVLYDPALQPLEESAEGSDE